MKSVILRKGHEERAEISYNTYRKINCMNRSFAHANKIHTPLSAVIK